MTGMTDTPMAAGAAPLPPGAYVEARDGSGPVSLTADHPDVRDALASLYRALHDLIGPWPHKPGHCPACHPGQGRRPLAVDGHQYQRRLRNRRRRR